MNYSFLDKLLFKIFLGNNIFQEVLFDVDKFFFLKKKKKKWKKKNVLSIRTELG